MPKTLDDLRAAPPSSRPERSLTLCLAPHLVAEVQSLTEEMANLGSPEAEPPQRRPRRAGEGGDPRFGVIQSRLAELLAEMAEHEGEMRVRAVRTDGQWWLWCDEHPARPEGQPGHDRDQRVTRGVCNADDLIADLATYAYEWNGDRLGDGDFARIFEPVVGAADKAEMAATVVAMYESRLDFPHWRSGLSANLARLSDSTSPAPSASPTSGSTDGSRPPSSADTTSTATGSP